MSIDPFPHSAKPSAQVRAVWRCAGYVFAFFVVAALDAALLERAAAIVA